MVTPSARSARMRSASAPFSVRPQAGGRLVEHEQRRIGGKRAGDFEDALAAERQIAGQFMRIGAEPDPFELTQRLGARARFLGAVEPQRAREEAGAGAQVGAEQHVVDERHVRAQLHVLDRCGRCRRRRSGAAPHG